MRFDRFALLFLVTIVAGACSAGTSSTPLAPSATPAASSTSGAAMRVEVKLADSLKMAPAEIAVPVGQAVTFVVTNIGANTHEFFVVDEAEHVEDENEMTSMGGMSQDEANGISLKAGETKDLTVTFDSPGTMIAGCHEPGHYGGGMKAMIKVGS